MAQKRRGRQRVCGVVLTRSVHAGMRHGAHGPAVQQL